MKTKNIYFYVAAALSLIVPVPGRFVFGLVMVILFVLQILLTVLFAHLISLLHLDDLKNVLVSIVIIAVTIFYKQLLILYCPLVALTLGFLIYLPALSSVTVEFFYTDNTLPLIEDLRSKMPRCLIFSVVALVISFIRDVVGYGTITFPSWHKVATVNLSFFSQQTYAGAFVATIPGAFVLVAVILAVFLFAKGQLDKIERSGGAA